MKNHISKVGWLLLFCLAGIFVWQYELISYGISQAKGQLRVIWNAKPISDVLADPTFPDSLKSTLQLVDEIRAFAVDSLGLKQSDNYTTVYDQQGKEILWVVSACNPFAFEPKIWSFPLIGSFTYKGFFDKNKAIKLAQSLNKEGYDVHMRSVSGWSTLGWFKDPILSNMLTDGPGDFANTIIHELTHSTLFIPDSMTFNENLATFIGNKGAQKYLRLKFGENSSEYKSYINHQHDSQLFTGYIVNATGRLDSLYEKMKNKPDSVKAQMKDSFISELIRNIDTLDLVNKERYEAIYKKFRPNNAFFITFLNYRERQMDFDTLLLNESGGSLRNFIGYWKKNYEMFNN